MMMTAGIAMLLAAGFIGARIACRVKFPAVSGYIVAGLLLGPTGFGIIRADNVGTGLDHFSQIALMLIAFGIGEHIELIKLKKFARSLLYIGICETLGALLLVSVLVYLVVSLTGFSVAGWTGRDYLILALLLGVVGVATAPAATLLVARELKAKGPLTQILMVMVAIDSGLSITLFGIVVSLTRHLLGTAGDPLLFSLLWSLVEILFSLLTGGVAGVLLLLLVNRLQESGEIMTAGLAVLLLMGEIALHFHFSPLLAGMAAGFILVNKAERDVRIFRELNKFEPPIYVLFFTLAGTHLDIFSLQAAGIIGFVYFLARISGKILGVLVGARLAGALPVVRRYLGFTLLPQAGVAIGLIFLLATDPELARFTNVITPVVLAAVFLSELIGPVSTRYALTKSGEAAAVQRRGNSSSLALRQGLRGAEDENSLVLNPWPWQRLKPPRRPLGVVVFHGDDALTGRALARVATIFSSYYRALPMAVEVARPGNGLPPRLFEAEHDEVHSMGYRLLTEMVPEDDLGAGLVVAAEYNNAQLFVLAYPLSRDKIGFARLLHTVTRHLLCPVAVLRFSGEIHTERILIPVSDIEGVALVYDVLCALASVGEHQLTLLFMMGPVHDKQECVEKEKELTTWLAGRRRSLSLSLKLVPTESRIRTIEEESRKADLLVMAADSTNSVQRFLFGSLVDSVADRVKRSLIVVYNGEKNFRA